MRTQRNASTSQANAQLMQRFGGAAKAMPQSEAALLRGKEQRSAFAGLVDKEQAEKRDARMAELEKNELVHEEMQKVMFVDVTAFHCQTCTEHQYFTNLER